MSRGCPPSWTGLSVRGPCGGLAWVYPSVCERSHWAAPRGCLNWLPSSTGNPSHTGLPSPVGPGWSLSWEHSCAPTSPHGDIRLASGSPTLKVTILSSPQCRVCDTARAVFGVPLKEGEAATVFAHRDEIHTTSHAPFRSVFVTGC